MPVKTLPQPPITCSICLWLLQQTVRQLPLPMMQQGRKLRKASAISGVNTDYIDGIQYEAGVISFIQTEEGRALNSSGSYHYEYSLTDHLGNSRLTFDTYNGTATQVQQDDYMPFGYEISRGNVTSPKNEYLYNKKELQEDLVLEDYGARFYDPVLGRWTTVDPLADESEDLSPYNYGENNPISMIDQDGMEAEDAAGIEQDKPKPKPTPKPIQLKEVVINGGVRKKQYLGSYTYYAYYPNQAQLESNRRDAASFLEKWTPLGREVMAYLSIADIASHMKFSKIGTPRAKTGKQLRKEWEKATGKKWPKEPGDPSKNQVAHHIKPLADGGEDGYPNIEPKPADEHRAWHQQLGDFIRWGSTRVGDVN